jgi:hypothetical protein
VTSVFDLKDAGAVVIVLVMITMVYLLSKSLRRGGRQGDDVMQRLKEDTEQRAEMNRHLDRIATALERRER